MQAFWEVFWKEWPEYRSITLQQYPALHLNFSAVTVKQIIGLFMKMNNEHSDVQFVFCELDKMFPPTYLAINRRLHFAIKN